VSVHALKKLFLWDERSFMKARLDAIIRREQAEYLEQLLPANSGLLAEKWLYFWKSLRVR
jgi:hypothetical protein